MELFGARRVDGVGGHSQRLQRREPGETPGRDRCDAIGEEPPAARSPVQRMSTADNERESAALVSLPNQVFRQSRQEDRGGRRSGWTATAGANTTTRRFVPNVGSNPGGQERAAQRRMRRVTQVPGDSGTCMRTVRGRTALSMSSTTGSSGG
jgi:hypothetical protein